MAVCRNGSPDIPSQYCYEVRSDVYIPLVFFVLSSDSPRQRHQVRTQFRARTGAHIRGVYGSPPAAATRRPVLDLSALSQHNFKIVTPAKASTQRYIVKRHTETAQIGLYLQDDTFTYPFFPNYCDS